MIEMMDMQLSLRLMHWLATERPTWKAYAVITALQSSTTTPPLLDNTGEK